LRLGRLAARVTWTPAEGFSGRSLWLNSARFVLLLGPDSSYVQLLLLSSGALMTFCSLKHYVRGTWEKLLSIFIFMGALYREKCCKFFSLNHSGNNFLRVLYIELFLSFCIRLGTKNWHESHFTWIEYFSRDSREIPVWNVGCSFNFFS
jgi:hypothetical protein